MSDLDTMGFGYYSPGQNAFQACVPRGAIAGECKPQKKRGPRSKLQQSIDAVSSFEERQAARTAKITAFKQGAATNFGVVATPSKPAKTASSRFATA